MGGTFKFKWDHKADEVYVTGTFDNWSKSEQLEKVGDSFEKTVTLSDASQKIYYKFVVDGTWTTDHTAPQEPDDKGNVNNVLTPERIIKEDTPATAMMNTVTPESTTAALAKDVPLEKKEEKEEPAPATETEAAATPSDVPGGFPVTPANDLDKPISINPLPATEAGLNPVKLAPGEKPAQATEEEINKHVKLDKESYEKSDALPGVETLPPVSDNMIPESSLPIESPSDKKDEVHILPVSTETNDVTINTVTPQSTTAALAGQVPLEPKAPKVPDMVKESQEAAKVDPEASAEPEEVREKAEVEAELLEKVPEAPATSSNAIAATAAGIGAAAVAAAFVAKDTVVDKAGPVVSDAAAKLPDSVKQALPVAVQDAIKDQAKEEKREEVSPEVPAPVKESIQESGKSPEAAASTAAVTEKKEMESELKEGVKLVPAEGEGSKTEETKPAEVTKPAEEPKPAEKPAAAAEPKPSGGEAAKPAEANGSEGKEAEASEAKNGSASKTDVEKKKKNRLSAMISKFKHKVSHKDK